MATILAIGATLVVVFLFLNLSPSEKKIKRQIEPLYAVSDTYAEWKARPLSEKILEHTAGLLRGQL